MVFQHSRKNPAIFVAIRYTFVSYDRILSALDAAENTEVFMGRLLGEENLPKLKRGGKNCEAAVPNNVHVDLKL